ncbi:hypothetical protein MAR_029957 [Mya arenaria]|uniref:Uncharacterized protein n=1 Tax=Mya arenaria TaxID=6604 RepID=A0ABY7DI06_MYAAR|nr:hypothetical protein MAR_029957 [Mya arenaria]
MSVLYGDIASIVYYELFVPKPSTCYIVDNNPFEDIWRTCNTCVAGRSAWVTMMMEAETSVTTHTSGHLSPASSTRSACTWTIISGRTRTTSTPSASRTRTRRSRPTKTSGIFLHTTPYGNSNMPIKQYLY